MHLDQSHRQYSSYITAQKVSSLQKSLICAHVKENHMKNAERAAVHRVQTLQFSLSYWSRRTLRQCQRVQKEKENPRWKEGKTCSVFCLGNHNKQ